MHPYIMSEFQDIKNINPFGYSKFEPDTEPKSDLTDDQRDFYNELRLEQQGGII